MNLDDPSLLPRFDPQHTLNDLESLPEDLHSAWQRGQTLPLPPNLPPLRQVVMPSVGAAALAADLLSAFAAETCPVPVLIHRDYGLPGFANHPETLVVICAVAGDEEELLAAFETALSRGCSVLVIAPAGALTERAAAAGVPVWSFAPRVLASMAVASVFGLLLALFYRLGWVPDPSAGLSETLTALREQAQHLAPGVSAALNPAKRYAGQLVGRWVTVFGAGLLAPVARHWKTQINELAKAPASFETLPEADHNALAALSNPADLLQSRTLVMFLMSPSDHPRNRLRSEFTRQAFMLEGANTDFYMAKGNSPLAQAWTALHFGNYLAWYLALAYQTNPAAAEMLAHLKQALSLQPGSP